MNRLITTLFVLIVVAGVVLAFTGVLRFHNTKDETSVTIDKKELIDEAKEAIGKTNETEHKAADGSLGSTHENTQPTAAPASEDPKAAQPGNNMNAPETGHN
jgi:hypothetical protein